MSDKFTLYVQNNSGKTQNIFMFQDDPNLLKNGFSQTAWLTNLRPVRDTQHAGFNWETAFQLQWSETETLKAGTVLSVGGQKDVSISGKPNKCKFYLDSNGAAGFSDPTDSKDEAGSFFIETLDADPIIPSDTFAFSLAMNKKMAFVHTAENNAVLAMEPDISYYVTAGSASVKGNEVISANQTTGKQKIVFPSSKPHARVTLDENNNWIDLKFGTSPFVESFKTELVEMA